MPFFRKIVISLNATLVAALFFVLSANSALAATKITDIRFGAQADQSTRIVLDLSKTSDYRTFTLSSPYRLVLDMPDVQLPNHAISGGLQNLIKEYRHGDLQPGVSRIVFELHKPVKITQAFILTTTGKLPTRLVIDIEQVSPATFESSKSAIFGNQELVQAAYIATPTPPMPSARAPVVIPSPEAQNSYKSVPSPWRKKNIMIDPGHGGNDPGAISKSGIREKNVTLAIAKALQEHLNATGKFNATLTRKSDYYIKLRERINIAREHEADLFISIHADSIGSSNVRGSSIYTLSETASDKESAKLAERENLSDAIAGVQLEEENQEVANILIDLAMRDTMNQSKMFANLMVDTMGGNGIKLLPNTHRYAGFAVLKAADVPSILIETGYLSNEKDAQLLNSKDHQSRLAQTMTLAIENYFETVGNLE